MQNNPNSYAGLLPSHKAYLVEQQKKLATEVLTECSNGLKSKAERYLAIYPDDADRSKLVLMLQDYIDAIVNTWKCRNKNFLGNRTALIYVNVGVGNAGKDDFMLLPSTALTAMYHGEL